MHRFTGLIGIIMILGIAYLCSNNRKKINFRLVASGLLIQVAVAFIVLKIPVVSRFFQNIGDGMHQLESFAKAGISFVAGDIGVMTPQGQFESYRMGNAFIFAFNIASMIILVCALVAVLYYLKIIQRIVSACARVMNHLMRVSGAEALSNIASAVAGQVEAQVMIRQYLPTMTRSEILASMSGSLACIAGSTLVVYANLGARADYMIAASLMAAPGALVISKMVIPETELSPTMGTIRLDIKTDYANLIDALVHGISDGVKIAVQMIGMIIGFIAIITMINWGLTHIHPQLSLDSIFGILFYPFAWAMGVPQQDVQSVATLLGQKIAMNEFVAYMNLTNNSIPVVTPKGYMIVTIAICGFANFGSVGMLLGAIGKLIPERRHMLAKIAMRALLCGTLASYMSATIAGMMI